jgi:hypothetical protein
MNAEKVSMRRLFIRNRTTDARQSQHEKGTPPNALPAWDKQT